MDDFIKANKGDIFFGISDLAFKPDTTRYKFKESDENISIPNMPDYNFIFAASIGDKASFNKLVNAGNKLGDTFKNSGKNLPLSYNLNGTYFALSNKKQNVDHYLGSATTNFDFINKLGDAPMGGYLNIQTLLKSFENQVTKDSSAKIAYDASLNMWDHIIWKGGNFSDGAILQSAEINLVDKTTNSLKQLNQYVAKFNELYREKRKKQQFAYGCQRQPAMARQLG